MTLARLLSSCFCSKLAFCLCPVPGFVPDDPRTFAAFRNQISSLLYLFQRHCHVDLIFRSAFTDILTQLESTKKKQYGPRQF